MTPAEKRMYGALEERAWAAEQEREQLRAQLAAATREREEAKADAEQARAAVLRAGRDPKWAALYAWLDDNRDATIKSLSDETGRQERELIAVRAALAAERTAHEQTQAREAGLRRAAVRFREANRIVRAVMRCGGDTGPHVDAQQETVDALFALLGTGSDGVTARRRVACGLIVRNGRVLVGRRFPGTTLADKWSGPGGKVEDGESDREACVRELREELGVERVQIGPLVDELLLDPPAVGRPLVLLYFLCLIDGEPQPKAFAELRWCAEEELQALDLTPGDRALVDRGVVSFLLGTGSND